MIDLTKLTPAPHGRKWVTEQLFHNAGHWVIFEEWDGNRNPKIGYFHEKNDAEFYAIARNAFDVMMRRGWNAERTDDDTTTEQKWYVPSPQKAGERWPAVWMNAHMYFDDPFTALVEADKWYKANVEEKR